MNQLEKVTITRRELIIGGLLLIAGFALLSLYPWAWWTLFAGGVLAWTIVFKRTALSVFNAPKKLWLIPIGVFGYLLLGIVETMIAQKFGLSWTSNPLSGHLLRIIFKLPFMLMGEELLGIGILEAARNKGASWLTSNLLSALIFGLMHVFVYWDGSLFSTLLHVLIMQSVGRLIFNYIYLKTGTSIWGSWITHVLVDLIALSL